MPFFTQWFFVGAIVSFTLAAAVVDVRTRRLPNWLTVPAFFAAIVFHTVTGGLAGLGAAMGGFAVGFGVLFVLWLIGGGGGGDVKLMGALGAWLGPMSTLLVFLLSTVLAVLGTFALMLFDWLSAQSGRSGHTASKDRAKRRNARQAKRASSAQPQRPSRRMLPYGAPVAVATWLLLAWRIVQWQA